MKLSLNIIGYDWPGGTASTGLTFKRIAQRAEEVGFDSLWVIDHFFQDPGLGQVHDPMLEAYTTLGFAAGATTHIELGVMVTGVTYRHPGVLVKAVTTLDVLSGGRAWLGIGAGWYEREHLGLGVPFPPLKERFERLEETLRIAHLMWSGEVGSFEGKHYTLAETLNSPPALQKPHPPILIGGTGETKTLRFVARYGDACNLFARLGEDVLRHKLEVLREHCQAEGRPYSDISRTVIGDRSVMLDASGRFAPERVIEHAAHLASLGFDYLHVSVPNVASPHALDPFGETIIPAIHAL